MAAGRAVPLISVSQANGIQIVANQTTSVVVTNPPWSLPGTTAIGTNITTRLRVQTGPVGEFAILPTNFCDVAIQFAEFTNVVPQTSIIASFTNTFATNLTSGDVSRPLSAAQPFLPITYSPFFRFHAHSQMWRCDRVSTKLDLFAAISIRF